MRHLISFSNLALMRIRISLERGEAHVIGLFLQHSGVCVCMCVRDGWGGALSCSKATYFPLHTSLDLFFWRICTEDTDSVETPVRRKNQ